MWTCPSCGRSFKQINQMHSCEVFDLERHLVGKSSAIVGLYHLLAGAMRGMESVETVPMKSTILFRVNTVFASVAVRRQWLDVYFTLASRQASERIRFVERASATRFVHRIRISSPDDIDEQLTGWLAEARALSAR